MEPAGTMAYRDYFSRQQELYSKTDARRIGPELERLSSAGKTRLSDVVDAARAGESPLHPYFEWDDHRAAESFRQLQAGRMTRTIMIYSVGGGQEREEPAFRSIEVKAVPQPLRQPRPMPSRPTAEDRQRASRDSPSRLVEVRRPASSRAESSRSAALRTAPARDEQQSGRMLDLGDLPDEEVIGHAFVLLRGFELTFGGCRARPAFESVFAPVFAAIAEARARDGEESR